ncbi:SPOR domain-containing protein [candidate division KSB1 bacterium]|nr:SPOR domain-containing protein [candidate division KSB1 bacterium]
MKKLFIYIFLILHFLLSGSLFSQKVEDRLIIWLENNSREELMKRLDKLKQTSPNSPTPIYVEALIEKDAEQAVILYKAVIGKFPNSIYAEQSLLKLAQYYFMRESYILARQLLDNLIDKSPNSILMPTAKYLAALCLVATNDNSKAKNEFKKYINEFPESQFQKIVQDELDRIVRRSEQEKNVSKMIVPQQPVSNNTLSSKRMKIYTVQVGAYGNKDNAERQKQFFSGENYATSVQTKYVSGRLLYLVWIEDFETIDEAQKFGMTLNELYGTPFRVVRK